MYCTRTYKAARVFLSLVVFLSLCAREFARGAHTLQAGANAFELRVIHSPGHTAGHLLLHEDVTGTLLTGDHIMGSAVPFTENYYLPGAPDPRDPLLRRPRFSGLRRP